MARPTATKRPSRTSEPRKSAVIGKKRLPINEVMDTLWYWMRERHSIHERRLAGQTPWTGDSILRSYKFTNLFRVFDRNTQFILNEVIPDGPSDLTETSFRIILFRTFNRIETWRRLRDHFGRLQWATFEMDDYYCVLSTDGPIYGPAYFIPAPKILGGEDNPTKHLRMIYLLMTSGFPTELKKLDHLKDALGFTQLYPGLGQFTAFQLLLDLNMCDHFNFSEEEWAVAGPGASDGLVRIFGKEVRGSESLAIAWLWENQHEYWGQLSLTPPLRHPTNKGVSAVDIEHALCEFDKYCRKKFPSTTTRRTKIKARFVPSNEPYTGGLPDKWTRLAAAKAAMQLPPAIQKNGEIYYEVSHIVMNSGSRFLVRWLGYDPDEDTWEDAENLGESAGQVLVNWHRKCQVIEDAVAKIGQFPPPKKATGSMSKRPRARPPV